MPDALPGARTPLHGLRDLRWVVLVAFLFGISAFHRDFAHLSLSIGGIPLFPGELTLALLAVLEVVRLVRRRRIPFGMSGPALLWAVYFGLGVVYTAVGLGRGFGLAALRDSSLVYYVVLFFLVQSVLEGREDARGPFAWVAAGSVAGSFWTTGSFFVFPQLSFEHGAHGFQALVAWLGLAYIAATSANWGGRWRRWRWLVAAPLFVVIYLAGYRTIIGAAVVGLVAASLWLILARGPGRLAARRLLIAGVAFCLVFGSTVLVARFALGEPAPGSPNHGKVSLSQGLSVITDRWIRLFERDTEPSAEFRGQAWAKALARIRADPWTGIGFGPAPGLYPDAHCENPTSPLSNCGNAHNTYLTLAMRLGIPGFTLWVLASLSVAWSYALEAFRRRNDEEVVGRAVFLSVVLASLWVFGFFSLFFESPYLSPYYWVTLAVMAETTRRLRSREGLALRPRDSRRARPHRSM